MVAHDPPTTMMDRSIEGWLESVKAGYGRFLDAFASDGYEDMLVPRCAGLLQRLHWERSIFLGGGREVRFVTMGPY